MMNHHEVEKVSNSRINNENKRRMLKLKRNESVFTDLSVSDSLPLLTVTIQIHFHIM